MKHSTYALIFIILIQIFISFLFADCTSEAFLKNQNADMSSMINSKDVHDFKILWKNESKDLITHKPLVCNGRVYYADWGGTVYATDVATGKIFWQRTLDIVDPTWAWHGFSGTGAVGEDMLFEASVEGDLYAFNINNGELLWHQRITDKPFAGNTGSLLFFENMVFVPVSSLDEGKGKEQDFKMDFQGSVEAYDAKTGKHLWQFKTVTGEGNGVAVWSGFAIDTATKTLYFDTGNNYTGKPTEMSDAVIAIDAYTGKLKWFNQCFANDLWTMAEPNGPDYDFGAAPVFFETKIEGKDRKLVAAGQKSGMLWILDAEDGTVVWKAQQGIGATGGGFMASPSVDDKTIFAWANNDFNYAEAEKHLMDIVAYKIGTGDVLWKDTKVIPAWMTEAGFVAGDLYFVGSIDGFIRAYNTSSGEEEWKSEKWNSISTSIVADDGKLFFGTGLPKMLGGVGESGTFYCIGLAEIKN